MVVKAVCTDCKNLKFVGVNVMRVFVVHFRAYVSRESNVESLCLVRLGFSFLVSWLYICEYSIPRGNKYKEKGEILSKVINEARNKENIPVINHNNINPKRNLNRSKLHFNNYVNSVFVRNIRNFLSNLI